MAEAADLSHCEVSHRGRLAGQGDRRGAFEALIRQSRWVRSENEPLRSHILACEPSAKGLAYLVSTELVGHNDGVSCWQMLVVGCQLHGAHANDPRPNTVVAINAGNCRLDTRIIDFKG